MKNLDIYGFSVANKSPTTSVTSGGCVEESSIGEGRYGEVSKEDY